MNRAAKGGLEDYDLAGELSLPQPGIPAYAAKDQ